jgi:hypothetical protein
MQVWLGNKYVGDLYVRVIDGSRDVSISVMNPENFDVQTIRMAIKERNFAIDRFALEDARGSGMLEAICRANRIPLGSPDLTVYSDIGLNREVFTWKVIAATKDDFEEIFDLPSFEPV